VDTSLVGARGDSLLHRPAPSAAAIAHAAARFVWATDAGERTPWTALPGFRLNAASAPKVRMRVGGEAVEAAPADGRISAVYEEHAVVVFENGDAYEFTLDTGERSADDATAGDGAILSPMPGKIVSVAAKAGAKLKKGEPILVLEAMKMEHTLTAPFDGKLVELNAKAGAQVSEGVVLAKLEAC
jgi:acetyl/propionyl-CoA carboxylase alpha subunit